MIVIERIWPNGWECFVRGNTTGYWLPIGQNTVLGPRVTERAAL